MHRSLPLALALALSLPARAQLLKWTPQSFSSDPVRAQIAGGPWTLGSGDYPAPNGGTSNFEPDYQPSVTVDANGMLQGLFDYRPEELEEAVLAASSPDGVNWTFTGEALDFADAGSDDGQGHPFAMAVGGNVYLYTLDRTPAEIDDAGFLVNQLNPADGNLLAGLPASEVPVPAPGATDSQRTTGLLNPDGIIGVVPGSDPVEILYVQKQLAAANGADLTTVRLARTSDGLTFEDLGAVNGLEDPCVADYSTCVTGTSVTYIASRGTLFTITNPVGAFQGYGLIFSAGLWGGDSDAYVYVGYAESPDLQNWTVYNGTLGNPPGLPLISTTGQDLTPSGQDAGAPLSWYAARAYAPSAVPDSTGCASLNLIFSGYSGSAKKTDDYRQVGQVSLDLSASGLCAVVATLPGGSATSGSTGGSSGGTTGSSSPAGGSSGGSGSATPASSTSAGSSSGGSTSGGITARTSSSPPAASPSNGASAPPVSNAAPHTVWQGHPHCATGPGADGWLALLAALGLVRRRRR